MKLTSIVYSAFINTYAALPFKRQFAKTWKALGLPKQKVYRDLKFDGAFDVAVQGKSFKLMHHHSTIENEVFWNGLGNSWEEDTIWIWEILCADANVIVDVGANTGIYSLIAKTLNPSGAVYAFEPVKRTYQCLSKNISANNFNVVLENSALSSIDGELVLYDTDADNQTSASLNPNKLKNFKNFTGNIVEYKIPTVKLDTYIERQGINRVDLMKIDVEMHEPEVLEGFKKYMAQHMPDIVIEILSQEIADKVMALINGLGYDIFHLNDKFSMKKYSTISPVNNRWNFLLCKRETSSKLSKYTN